MGAESLEAPISEAQSILIFTDNTLKNGGIGLTELSPLKNNVAMVEWLRRALKNSDDCNTYYMRSSTSTLYIPPVKGDKSGDNCKDLAITLKIFFLNTDYDIEKARKSIYEAFEAIELQLGVKKVDLLILSHSSSDNCVGDAELNYWVETWKAAVDLYKNAKVSNIGLSDMNYNQLVRFCERVSDFPTVLQINAQDIDKKMPSKLVAFAKAKSITLQIHSDNSKNLKLDTLRALIDKNGKGSFIIEDEIPTLKESLEFKPIWALKLTGFFQDRSVIDQLRFAIKTERVKTC